MDKWLKYGCMKYIDAVRLYEISEIRIYENRKGMKFGQNTRITDLRAMWIYENRSIKHKYMEQKI